MSVITVNVNSIQEARKVGIFGEEWVGYLTATGSAAQDTSPAKRAPTSLLFLTRLEILQLQSCVVGETMHAAAASVH